MAIVATLTGLCAAALVFLIPFAGAMAAAADTTPAPQSTLATPADPTPTPTPAPTPLTMDPLPSGLVTHLPLTVAGSSTPGDHVHVSTGAGATDSSRCEAVAGTDGRWSCAVTSVPNGPGIAVRAASDSSSVNATGRVDVLSPPTIAGAGTQGLVTGGGLHGTAYPGASVTVRAENGSTCTFPADSSGVWGCVLGQPLPNGRHTVTATQQAPFSTQSSAATAPLAIIVDTIAPAPPRITPLPATSRAAGPVALSGSGEVGAHVTVYASDHLTSTVVCSAVVTPDGWSCDGVLPAGTFLVSALQRDAAGNVSGGSNALTLTIGAPSSAPSAASPSAAPAAPPPSAAPAAPAAPPGTTPAPQSQSAPLQAQPDWASTPFTVASAPVVSVQVLPGWLRSLLLASAALILLLLPARLLAATVARNRTAHPAARGWSLFGRNRSTAELRAVEAGEIVGSFHRPDAAASAGGAPADTAVPARSPWMIPAGIAAAAALVTLSTPVPDAAGYLRVLLAVALALALVNGVWIGIGHWLAPHVGAGRPDVVFRPVLLIVVAATAIGSRLFELQPALLYGLVLGIGIAAGTGRVARGRIAALQLSGLAVLGVLLWLLLGLLPRPSDALSAFVTQLVDAGALLALGSAAIALLPLGGLAGRAVFQWSRAAWLVLSLVVYTLLFALLLPVESLVDTGQGTLVLIIGAVAFAALSVSVWLWEKYVEPSR